MTKTLYVGNLAPETTEDRLRDLFSAHGREVASVTLATYSKTGKSRGFGFVEMTSEEDAEATLAAMRGTSVDGRELKLGEATNVRKSERSPKRESDYGGGGGRFGGGGKRGRR